MLHQEESRRALVLGTAARSGYTGFSQHILDILEAFPMKTPPISVGAGIRAPITLVLVICALILALSSAVAQTEDQTADESFASQTVISSNITTDTTWASGNIYYVSTSVNVNAGVTLTIEPGVQVNFSQNAGLRVLGTLKATGSAAEPILFTGSTKQAGWWLGLRISGVQNSPLTTSVLEYVTIEYGGGNSYGALYLEYATVPVKQSTIRHSSKDGIYGWYGGVAHLSDVTLANNADFAVRFIDASVNPQLARLTVQNNGANVIGIGGGTMTGTHVWENVGVPYRLTGNQTVGAGATLTVEPGVQVHFAENVDLRILGRLHAVGTEQQRILFTGVKQEAGSWAGIRISGSQNSPLTTSALEYVTIEYGGGNNYGALYFDHASAPVKNMTIRHSSKDGIYGWYGGVAHLTNVTLTNNGGYAVQFIDGSMNPQLEGLTVSGNGVNAVALGGGTLKGNHVRKALGIPYRITAEQTVDLDATLTVEPGAQIQFAQNAGLRVKGTLKAVGSAAQPILFTGSAQQAGWWGGIRISGTQNAPLTTSALEHVTVEYAGGNGYGALYLEHATVPVKQSTIRHSSNDGIYGWYGGVAHLSDVTLTNNGRYPAQFIDGSLNPQLARLTVSGNGVNAIALGSGTMTGEHRWENAGADYLLTGVQTVGAGATLTIEPGVQVAFAQNAGLTVRGTLQAIGGKTQPITFTGTTKQPGWWSGIRIEGSASNDSANAAISYATIEYGGGNNQGNVYVAHGRVAIERSILRHSSSNGLYAWYGASGSVIESSQIVDNAEFGVRNIERSKALLAANNWWGSPTGPLFSDAQIPVNCNPGGVGSKVSAGVVFTPFLASADADPGPIAPADVRLLSITPQRWFAPADNTTRIFVTITLTDGNGRPLPGRQVRLSSTRGSVQDGGVTDVQGKTFAYLRSASAGDADLVATVDASACEAARSQVATVTFTAGNPAGELMAEVEAPYMNGRIEIVPEPIMRGVPTKLRATLTNPNDFPILVDGLFGYAQAGIGLTFGPVGEVRNQLIPARGTGVIEVDWTPSVTGHYCVQFEYTSRAADGVTAAAGAGRSQRNLNVYPGPFLGKKQKDSIDKARRANDAISDGQFLISVFKDRPSIPGGLVQGQMVGNILDFNYETGGGINCALAGGTNCKGWRGPRLKLPGDSLGNLKDDPPRQDYTVLAEPEDLTFPPLQPGNGIPASRAKAINELAAASADLTAKLIAAALSHDRYGGAAQANDLEWASRQANAYLFYLGESARAMITVGDKIDALVQALKSEGITDLIVTADDYRAYQQRLKTEGFNQQELEAARIAGLTDEGIAEALQRRINMDPEKMAGDMLVILPQIANAFRNAGLDIIAPPAFGISMGGSPGRLAENTPDHNLVRVFETVGTIEVGNPRNTTATLDLRVRRIDLPPDWNVTVTPQAPVLQPGESISVTVAIQPGTAAVQGAIPRVAVEGYIGNDLIGGVTFDVLLPMASVADAVKPIYLPAIQR
jgi:hypothetical protein